ncbi:hypothetical protein [Escherichia coli]|uniref:hypothetical protein n=1 Tax=Escherichia coli TaxID=562 RepID=UPI004067C3C0
MSCINDLNTGDIRVVPFIWMRRPLCALSSTRIDHINHHPDQPLPVAQIVDMP